MNMDKELQIEARKQYFKYFRVWFILAGVALVVFLVGLVGRANAVKESRGNSLPGAERVFDYADVLTDEEENKLRDRIAKAEEKIACDIVLVTVNQVMGETDSQWSSAMMNYADDFYDNRGYGYDKVHGDGVLLLDNWYEGQGGSWLSACGRVYEEFGTSDIDDVLDAVYYEVVENPYKAYSAYVDEIEWRMSEGIPFPGLAFIIPLVVMAIFVMVKLKSRIGENTTKANTYVEGGKPVINSQADILVNKYVTKRRIPQSSGGSSTGSSGRGGSHRSSSGVSHGGGGRRR